MKFTPPIQQKRYIMFQLFILVISLFSPTFASAQQAGEELIIEDFDYSPGGWLVEKNSSAESDIKDGVYSLNNKTLNQSKGYYKKIEIDPTKNYSIEIRFLQKSGKSNIAYGLVWNRLSDDDYLCFKVTLDGMYRIDGKKEGKEIIIQDWKKLKKNDLRRLGQNQVLSIVKTEKNTTYYVNENKMFVGANIPLTGHEVGILLDNQMEVKVDYIRVIWNENDRDED